MDNQFLQYFQQQSRLNGKDPNYQLLNSLQGIETPATSPTPTATATPQLTPNPTGLPDAPAPMASNADALAPSPSGLNDETMQKYLSMIKGTNTPTPMATENTPATGQAPEEAPRTRPFFSWPGTTESNPFIGNLPASNPAPARETNQALADSEANHELEAMFAGPNSTSTTAAPIDKLTADMDKAKDEKAAMEGNASSQTPSVENAMADSKHATSGHTGSQTLGHGNKLEINIPEGKDQETLKDAQHRSAYAELVNRLGRAGEIAGTALSRQPLIGQAGFDEQIKGAQEIVKNFKDRQEQAKYDPNSPESQAAKQLMARAGIKVNGAFTAAMFDKYAPFVQKAQEGEETRNFRLMQYKMHQDYINQAKQSLADQHLQSAFEGRGAPPDVARDLQIQGDLKTIQDLKAKGPNNWTTGDRTTFLTAYRQLLAKSSRAVGGNNAGDYIPSNILTALQEKMNNITTSADPIHIANAAQPLLEQADRVGAQANKRIADYQANTYHAYKAALSPESRSFYEQRLAQNQPGQPSQIDPAIIKAKVQYFMSMNPHVTDPNQAYQILKDHRQL